MAVAGATLTGVLSCLALEMPTQAGRAYLLGRLVEEQRREYGLAPARDAA